MQHVYYKGTYGQMQVHVCQLTDRSIHHRPYKIVTCAAALVCSGKKPKKGRGCALLYSNLLEEWQATHTVPVTTICFRKCFKGLVMTVTVCGLTTRGT